MCRIGGGNRCPNCIDWIRFNPDSNRDKTPFKAKLECLRKEIEKHIKRIKEGKDTYQFEIHKLFY